MLFAASCSILKIPYKISPEETQVNRENCFNHVEAIVKEYGCRYTRDDTSMQIYIDKSDSVNKESDEIIAISINNDKIIMNGKQMKIITVKEWKYMTVVQQRERVHWIMYLL